LTRSERAPLGVRDFQISSDPVGSGLFFLLISKQARSAGLGRCQQPALTPPSHQRLPRCSPQTSGEVIMSQFRSTLIAALVALGGAAVAGAQAPTQTPAQVPQQHARAGKGHRGKFAKRGDRQLFKNIKLGDAEKANVKAVRQKYAPQMKALRAQFKPQIEQARQARQRGDTAAMKNLWAQSSAQRGQAKKLR